MSHTVSVKTQITEPGCIQKAALALGYQCEIAALGKRIVEKLFESEVEGIAKVKIPTWQLPIVIAADGTLQYDNYEGRWGDPVDLEKFKAQYSEELSLEHWQNNGFVLESKVVYQDGTRELVFAQ